jgi:hypothetical protein
MRNVITKLLTSSNWQSTYQKAEVLITFPFIDYTNRHCRSISTRPNSLILYSVYGRSFFEKVKIFDWFNNQYTLSLTLYCSQTALISTLTLHNLK